MADLKLVTYCGLYCGLCSSCNRIPKQAIALRDTMKKESWDQWGKEIPQFSEFWEFLNMLTDSEANCSCRASNCGPPFCGIRKCAVEKGIEICPFCDEYPCHRIKGLAKGYVTLLADGDRLKALGIDQWIEEQESRRATGFAYVDIRCLPYEIPDK
jgi:hypothetical protein